MSSIVNPTTFYSFSLFQATGLLSKHADAALSRATMLTLAQCRILLVIELQPAISQQALASCFSHSPAAISRIIEVLQEKKLLKRSAVPNNRRLNQLHLTDSGKAAVAQAVQVLQTLEQQIYGQLSSEELTNLQRILGKMVTSLESAVPAANHA